MSHFLSPMVRDPAAAWTLRVRGRDEALATRVEAAFDSATRKRGLLGRDGLPPGTALVLAPCAAVHTLFMRFTIDVIYSDRQGRVLKTVSSLRPWRLSAVWRRGFATIEMASGAAELPRVGDQLELSKANVEARAQASVETAR
jgi:uncharacterized membrane protein (UPF0127 family)